MSTEVILMMAMFGALFVSLISHEFGQSSEWSEHRGFCPCQKCSEWRSKALGKVKSTAPRIDDPAGQVVDQWVRDSERQ